MSIQCPYCGSPDWEPAPKPYTYRHKGRENSIIWAKCNYCGRYFYIFRTRIETFAIRMEMLGPPKRRHAETRADEAKEETG